MLGERAAISMGRWTVCLRRALILTVLLLLCAGRGEAAGTDPTAEPIPEYDVDIDAKAFVLETEFTSREEAALRMAEVRKELARAHIGNPPLLRFDLIDRHGTLLASMNQWHPLWHLVWNGDRERLVVRESAVGRFAIPFIREATELVVIDIPLEREVLRGDLAAAVKAFCETEPDDPDCEVADLAISELDADTSPPFVLLGGEGSLEIGAKIANLGPSTPVDALVSLELNTGGGVVLSSQEVDVEVLGVGVGSPAQMQTSVPIQCVLPGFHAVEVVARVAPLDAFVVDFEASNDEATATLVVDCATPVAVNIHPGSSRNPINTTADQVPLALLTTQAGEYQTVIDFDATTVVDSSVRFGTQDVVTQGGGTAPIHASGHREDARELDERTRDGDTDLLLHPALVGSGLDVGAVEGCVRGLYQLDPGTQASFYGCDAVDVIR